MPAAVVLFTSDLRVNDNPALRAACRADAVVPLFVLDDALLAGPAATPNRVAFLLDCLADLRASLRARGGDLVVRRGDPAAVATRIALDTGADAVHLSADVSAFAARRARRLRSAADAHGISVVEHPGVTVVPPGAVLPSGGGDHFKVFTPYHRAWGSVPLRPVVPPPERVRLPEGVDPGRLPEAGALAAGAPSPRLAPGGEAEARRRFARWRSRDMPDYDDAHDDLAADRTSRLSPHLHFGTVSAGELVHGARGRPGGAEVVRQLCWRDFHHQVVAAFPAIGHDDYRPRGGRWRHAPEELAAWEEGRTGYPIVDAGMRQLTDEGWMHNRTRMVTASFLTKTLGIDWRHGARHFARLLVDADVANNFASWQWVAGTGNDTRPNRVLNPLRQAERFDPDGAYVRRHVPELAAVKGKAVHRPWDLPESVRRSLGYPDRIADL